jgi:hypothetical protein
MEADHWLSAAREFGKLYPNEFYHVIMVPFPTGVSNPLFIFAL